MIKNVAEKKGNNKIAAIKIGCTIRFVDRYIHKYKHFGKDTFSHKNKGVEPSITLPTKLKNTLLSLYDGKYQDANFRHYKKLLKERENITISYSALYNLLTVENKSQLHLAIDYVTSHIVGGYFDNQETLKW